MKELTQRGLCWGTPLVLEAAAYNCKIDRPAAAKFPIHLSVQTRKSNGPNLAFF